MTLHWWMHWFWVTSLVFLLSGLCCNTVALPFDTVVPLHHIGLGLPEDASLHDEVTFHDPTITLHDAKLILNDPKVTLHDTEVTLHDPEVTLHDSKITVHDPEVALRGADLSLYHHLINLHDSDVILHSSEIVHDSEVTFRDSSQAPLVIVPPAAGERRAKAMYIQSKGPVTPSPATTPPSKLFLESLDDKKPSTAESTPQSSNNTTLQPLNLTTTAKPRDNLTKQELPVQNSTESDYQAVQSVTEQAWLLETSLTELSHPSLVEASQPEGHTGTSTEAEGGIRAGAVTGIALGVVALATLMATTAFLLYRRRYLNKPQTLNDKCSNPDSSGYLDDSTVRENSEEMYSLDNDSFLNSLEAMTIQNYWTESVKHSKL